MQRQQDHPRDDRMLLDVSGYVVRRSQTESTTLVELDQKGRLSIVLGHCSGLLVQPPTPHGSKEITQTFPLHHEVGREYIVTHFERHWHNVASSLIE